MSNRKRKVQIKFRVTEGEKEIIMTNYKRSKEVTLASYLRKICIDTVFINIDFTPMKEYSAELGKIGHNINQIAKKVNTTDNIYKEDMIEIKELLNQVYEQHREIAKKVYSING